MNIDIFFDLVSRNATAAEFRAEIQRQVKEDEEVKEQQKKEQEKERRQRRGAPKKGAGVENQESNKDAKPDAAKEDEDFVNFLNRKNLKGETLLHVAAEKGSFELVEELIGLGASLDAKNGSGKTAFNLIQDKPSEEELKKAALLKTRGNWTSLAKGFNVNRVIHMLGEAQAEIINARGIPKLLFIGPSGCGKSTFMNSRFGVEYDAKLKGGCRPEATEKPNGVKPVAPVGHGVSSTTLYPYARQYPGNVFTHVDLAGLFDNRGHEHKIVAASTTQWVTNMAGGIQGILVFLDLPAIQARRSAGIREVAEALFKITQGKKELLSSVRYVITKVMNFNFEQGLTVDTLIAEYLEDLLRESREKADNNTQFMLEDMVNNSDKIFLNDLSKESADEIDGEFKDLVPKHSSSFNFMLHDNAQQNFKDFLIDLPTKYLEIKRRINVIPVNIRSHEDEIKKLEASNAKLENEIKDLEDQLKRPFSPDANNAGLVAIRNDITRNQADLDAQSLEITRIQNDISAKWIELRRYDSDVRHHVHTAHEHGFAQNARKEVTVEWVFGAPVIRMESSYKGWGALSSELVYPHSTGRSGVDHYDGKTVDWVDEPEGTGRYKNIFRGSEGIAEYTVQFYAEERYLPRNRQMIANLRQEIAVLEASLLGPQRDINRLTAEKARLKNQETGFIKLAKDNHIQFLNDTIATKKEAIKKNNEDKKKLEEINEQLREEKASLELELAVNRKLFETISTIIQDLGVNELNTKEFLDEVAKDAKKPSFTAGAGSKKPSANKPFAPKSSVPKAAFYREAPLDTHWYEDHEVETLLQNCFGKDKNVDVLAALDAHHLEGQTLQQSLQQWLRAPVNDGVRHIVMPVNLGNLHWVALYINVENRQSPSIAAYIDPFGHAMPQDIKDALKTAFPGIQDKNVFTSPIELQDDGYNCGPWIVEILKVLVYKGALPDESYDIHAARQAHQRILERQPEAAARAEM